MADGRIDEILSTANTHSEVIDGRKLALQSMDLNTFGGVQVKRVADSGDYEVHLEAAMPGQYGSMPFGMIGVFDQEEDGQTASFPIISGCLYRLRHVSGEACRGVIGS